MATPITMVDTTTDLNAANLNKYLTMPKVEVKQLYARVVFSGGVLIVAPAPDDSAGIVTGDLAYNGGQNRLDITVSGFINRPRVQTTTRIGDLFYWTKAQSQSNTLVSVAFYHSTTLARITTGADANMDFEIWIEGY